MLQKARFPFPDVQSPNVAHAARNENFPVEHGDGAAAAHGGDDG